MTRAPAPREGALRIGVVCTANRFRSPVAAAVLRRALAHVPVEVASMASDGPAGAPAIASAVRRAARAHGLDLSGHRSTAAAPGLLADRDLILCFEAHHAAAAIAVAGAPRGRTFLMREFLDLPPARPAPDAVVAARELVAAIGAGGVRDLFATRLQVPDPMAGPRFRHGRRVDEIVALAEAVALRLAAPDPA